uniref:Uncharacterized protein n=1 Tax=Romanomermis culicivorax TaxID=13658 RepID=A0A915L1A6_ROMCU
MEKVKKQCDIVLQQRTKEGSKILSNLQTLLQTLILLMIIKINYCGIKLGVHCSVLKFSLC